MLTTLDREVDRQDGRSGKIPCVDEEGDCKPLQATFPAPKTLFLLLTSECNLHCKHCHMWMNKDDPLGLSLPEKLEVVRQFHQLNPKGNIVLCGGEFMLKEDEFFSLTKLCRDLGVSTTAVTNGSLVNEEHYERLLLEGPDHFFISLDGHLSSVHDYIRGTKGSHEHVVKVLADLARMKKERLPDSKVRIYTNTTLFEGNLYSFHECVSLAKSLGVDGARFECLHETVQNRSRRGDDPFYRKNFFKDKTAAIRMFDEIIEAYKADYFVVNRESDWERMKLYVAHRTQEGKSVCAIFENAIFVEQTGDLLLCPYSLTSKEIKSLGNARNMSLSEFWVSASAENARNYMRTCCATSVKECGLISGFRGDALLSVMMV